MAVNLNKIKGLLAEKGFTQKKMARYMDLSNTSFTLKMKGKRNFSAEEIEKLSLALNCPINIFFINDVSKNETEGF